MLKHGITLIAYTGATGILYLGALIGTQAISNSTAPPIHSQSHLEKILEEESVQV